MLWFCCRSGVRAHNEMSLARSKTGWIFLASVPFVAGLAYYFSWRSGCYFDAKQGIGNYQLYQLWSLAAWLALLVTWLALVIAVPLLSRPTMPVIAGSLLFFGVLATPLGFLLLAAGEVSGVQSCGA